MPNQPSWIDRVPEIQRALERLPGPSPWVDRTSVQRLFGLSPRQSVRLMWTCPGAIQVGRSALVPVGDLLALVRQYEGSASLETRRRTRLHETLGLAKGDVRRRSIPIPDVPAEALGRQWGELPGVRLSPGRLEVDFSDPEELLRRLFELSQAISNDFAEFERAAGG